MSENKVPKVKNDEAKKAEVEKVALECKLGRIMHRISTRQVQIDALVAETQEDLQVANKLNAELAERDKE